MISGCDWSDASRFSSRISCVAVARGRVQPRVAAAGFAGPDRARVGGRHLDGRKRWTVGHRAELHPGAVYPFAAGEKLDQNFLGFKLTEN